MFESVSGDTVACGQDVVLVDDVLTTGATFRACQKSLTAAGHNVLGGGVARLSLIPVEMPV